MQRMHITPRMHYLQTVQAQGLVYANTTLETGQVLPYWDEGKHYHLTKTEVEALRVAAHDLHIMYKAAGDYVIRHRLYDRLGIPSRMIPAIVRSWEDDLPSLYGRYDMWYGGEGTTPKLLEYNAQTPTSLVEASLIQWYWRNDTKVGRTQWNDIHETLVAGWKRNVAHYEKLYDRKVTTIHFACTYADKSGEDYMTVTYLADTAEQAGYKVKVMYIEDLSVESLNTFDSGRYFNGVEMVDGWLDDEYRLIQMLFVLYPWEALWNETPSLAWSAAKPDGLVVVEPAYKAMWSNKAMLPLLYQMFGKDSRYGKHLLPAYFEGQQPSGFTSFARKPFFSREGDSITLVKDGQKIAGGSGRYGQEGFILQQLAPLPNFPDLEGSHHPVMGVWMIDNWPAGLGIREGGLITDNRSRFVPHVIS